MRHPECAERVTLATERVKNLACVDMAMPAAEGEVAVARGEAQGGEVWDGIVAKVKKVHDPDYIDKLEVLANEGGGALDQVHSPTNRHHRHY